MRSASPQVMVIGHQAVGPSGLPESQSGARYMMADDMADVRDYVEAHKDDELPATGL